MTTELHLHDGAADCVRFESQLGAWLEQELGAADQAFMRRHRSECTTCDTLVRDIEQLVADASALPALPPARDLWPEIESRLETPVIPMLSVDAATTSRAVTATASRAPRTISLRRFAVAATLLVSVTSAVTWQLTRSRNATNATVASTAPRTDSLTDLRTDSLTAVQEVPAATVELATGSSVTTDAPSSALSATDRQWRRLVARNTDVDAADINVTYEREISALRRIVDERFAELDSGTVRELRRNLEIIDRAIIDSRAALRNDPRNSLGSSQLDRALEAKLDLLRRVALL